MMTKAQEGERAESIARLREWLKPGDTIGCILRHVSRSGMQREISLVKLTGEDAGVLALDYNAARALQRRVGKRDGLVIGGCGMDMGFALVSDLSAYLYPDGFGCIGEKCPSNDHSNGDRDHTPHVECSDAAEHISTAHEFYRERGRKCKRPGCHWHNSGCYALRHRWL